MESITENLDQKKKKKTLWPLLMDRGHSGTPSPLFKRDYEVSKNKQQKIGTQ